MIVMTVTIGIAAFLFGFLLGVSGEPQQVPRLKRSKTKTTLTKEFIKDYQNFLSYDGSEQK